jgi:hypothetical protein
VTVLSGKDDTSVIKIGLRNLKILRDLVSTRRFRKTNQTYDGIEESYYVHSDGAEFLDQQQTELKASIILFI